MPAITASAATLSNPALDPFDAAGNPKVFVLKGVHDLASVYALSLKWVIPSIIRDYVYRDEQWGFFPMGFVLGDNGETINGISTYIGAHLVESIPPTDPPSQMKLPIFGSYTAYADVTVNPCGRIYAPNFTNSGAFQIKLLLNGSTDFGRTRVLLDSLLEGVDFPCDFDVNGYTYSRYSRFYPNGSDGTLISVIPTLSNSKGAPLTPPGMHPYIIQAPYTISDNITNIVRLEGDDYLISVSGVHFQLIVEGDPSPVDSWPTSSAKLLSPLDNGYYPTAVSESRALTVTCGFSLIKEPPVLGRPTEYSVSGRLYNTYEEGEAFWNTVLMQVTPTMLSNNRKKDETVTREYMELGYAYITANMVLKGQLNRSTGQIDLLGVHAVTGYGTDYVTGHFITTTMAVTPFPTRAPENIWAQLGPDTCGDFDPPCYIDHGGFNGSAGCVSHYSEFYPGRVFEDRVVDHYLGQGVLLGTSAYYYSPTDNPSDFGITAMFYNNTGVAPQLESDPFGNCGTYYTNWKPRVEAASHSATYKNAGVSGSGFPNVRRRTDVSQYSLDGGKTWADYRLGGEYFFFRSSKPVVKLGGGCALLSRRSDDEIFLFNKGVTNQLPRVDCLDDGLASTFVKVLAPMASDQCLLQVQYPPGVRTASAVATLAVNAQKHQVILNSATTLTILNEGLITSVEGVQVTYNNSSTYSFSSATISGKDSNVLTLSPPMNTVGITGISVSYTRVGGNVSVYRLVAVNGLFTSIKMTHVRWESIYSVYTVGTHAAGVLDPEHDMSYPFVPVEYSPLVLLEKIFSDIDISVEDSFVNIIPFNGGVPSVSMVLSGGALPPGLLFGSYGLIEGTLDIATISLDINGTGHFTYSFTVTAVDSVGHSVSREYSITCIE
jgi:hypothetical protein